MYQNRKKKKKKSLLKVRNKLLVVEFMIALKVLEAKCSPNHILLRVDYV